VHASDGATARLYRENGCRLVTVVSDAVALARASAAELAAAKG
jgi:2-keto-3-deoxy-L-rhamnonate aldolase RhmA